MRNAALPKPKDVFEYITQQPQEFWPVLEDLHAIIKSVAPEATETISYRIPVFNYHYMLVGIGVNKKYASFYVMSPPLVDALKKELAGLKVSGSTIHFSPGETLPADLIKKIVQLRMDENAYRAEQKKLGYTE